MIALYQSTFFLALALLAIVITLFVLAVSLLGRAIRISIEEQEKTEKDQLARSQNETRELNKQFTRASKKHVQPDIDRIQKSINKIKWYQRLSKLKLRWIRIKPNFLRVSLGVLSPAALFIIAIATSALAIYFESESHDTAISLWYTSLITLILGIANMLLTLRVTQSVAITSEETSYLRQKEMMISALTSVEEGKIPAFVLSFDENIPFNIISGQNKTIPFRIQLIKGTIARKPKAMFFLPEGFSAPAHAVFKQWDQIPEIGGLQSFECEFTDCTQAFNPTGKITITASPEKGSYEVMYKLGSEEFNGELERFTVNVI